MAWTDEWMEYLDARAACIRSMIDQRCTYEDVVRTLNLADESHARAIDVATRMEIAELRASSSEG